MFGAAPVLNSAPQLNARAVSWKLSAPAVAAALVILPVFVQAPWVRSSPLACALFTAVLVALGLRLRGELGALLIGFSGSWLAGAMFWGWLRLHPLWHLPVEAFALPLAIAGLQGPWRRAGQFYLGALIGTACTDAATNSLELRCRCIGKFDCSFVSKIGSLSSLVSSICRHCGSICRQ